MNNVLGHDKIVIFYTDKAVYLEVLYNQTNPSLIYSPTHSYKTSIINIKQNNKFNKKNRRI